MKAKPALKLIAAATLLVTVSVQVSVRAQGTAFTYEGVLNNGANPANGFYDFQFRVFDTGPINTGSSLGSPSPNSLTAVGVTNGLFSAVLDFGNSLFASGAPRWLEIAVRTNGTGSFTTFSSRPAITATPYAITASNLTGVVSSAGLAGTYSRGVTLSNPGNSFTGNGAGLANVNAATLNGYPACGMPCYWNLAGNGGTTGVEFLGTTDSEPLTLKVNNVTALEFRPALTMPNIIGALASAMPAVLGPNVSGVVIAGGNAPSGPFSGNQPSDFMAAYDDDGTIGGGFANKVGIDNLDPTDGAFATVGGGAQNTAAAFGATIAGGLANLCIGARSTVAGGNVNYAISDCSFIGGGSNNIIRGSAEGSTVAGGWRNLIDTNAVRGTIAGGEQNVIGQDAADAAIGGGAHNLAHAPAASVAGGILNIAVGYAAAVGGGEANSSGGSRSVVGGGYTNRVTGDFSVVGGGSSNTCFGQFAVIGGGAANLCVTDYGTIPGGCSNYVNGLYSLAAGQQAIATNMGCFVWADSQSDPFRSTVDDQFSVRARGGLRLNTDTTLVFGDTSASILSWDQGGAIELGDSTSSGKTPFIDFHYGIAGNPLTDYNVRLINDDDGQLTIKSASSAVPMARLNGSGLEVNGMVCCSSDRNRKQNFQPVDSGAVLAKVVALPLSKWNYKEDAHTTHIGPMAQDFYTAFGVGPDDQHIATVDADGVALAAIQGLNQKLQEKDAAIEQLTRRLERLEQMVSTDSNRVSR